MLLFEIIHIALGTREKLSRPPTDDDWHEIYQMAIKQSLIGLIFTAVEKINAKDATVKPPMTLFYEWLGQVNQIEQQSRFLNEASNHLTRIFANGGLRSCVLKGQGIAQLYPQPERRQSGDIDLWVEGSREQAISFLKSSCFHVGKVVIHHVDAHIIDGVECEIHFFPIWLYNPYYNKRLQRFFINRSEEQFTHYDKYLGYCYPTVGFNVVYNLVHIFHHLLDEGVGLRQVVDYYFILTDYKIHGEKINVTSTISSLGLMKFAGALMYVLQVVCGMPSELMICKPEEKAGRLLIQEIMETGNFGKYDNRFGKKIDEGVLNINMRKAHRWIKLMRDYPSEVLCIPCWKLWHFCWRMYKGYL